MDFENKRMSDEFAQEGRSRIAVCDRTPDTNPKTLDFSLICGLTDRHTRQE